MSKQPLSSFMCDRCMQDVSADATSCPFCGAAFVEESRGLEKRDCDPPENDHLGVPNPQNSAMGIERSWITAAFLAFFDPGLGFVYIGKIRIGVAVTLLNAFLFLLIYPASLIKPIFGVLIIPVILGSRLFHIVKAGLDARRIRSMVLKPYNRWYAYLGYCIMALVLDNFILAISPIKFMKTDSVSMEPMIMSGDYVVIDKSYYKHNPVRIGDVVVFKAPKEKAYYLKRSVALGGQTIKIHDAIVYVDETPFMPSLAVKRDFDPPLKASVFDARIVPAGAGNNDQYGPITVPQGSLFVLGDHRTNSYDSRYYGCIGTSDIIGKVMYIYWSEDLDRVGLEVR